MSTETSRADLSGCLMLSSLCNWSSGLVAHRYMSRRGPSLGKEIEVPQYPIFLHRSCGQQHRRSFPGWRINSGPRCNSPVSPGRLHQTFPPSWLHQAHLFPLFKKAGFSLHFLHLLTKGIAHFKAPTVTLNAAARRFIVPQADRENERKSTKGRTSDKYIYIWTAL